MSEFNKFLERFKLLKEREDNNVFIAAATLLTIRLLNFKRKRLPDEKAEVRARRIIFMVLILTLIPSVYFGYDIVKQDRFIKNANHFIEKVCVLPNDYLLNKNIDAKNNTIALTYGDDKITEETINGLKSKLEEYYLYNTTLEIKQGFSYLVSERKLAYLMLIGL